MRRLFVLASGLGLLAGLLWAEPFLNITSVTATSQTVPLPRPAANVTLCNFGTNEAYYRLFDENETPAAATTAHLLLVAGTATVPICAEWGKAPTEAANYKAVAIVCDTAETATVHIIAK